MYVCMYSDTGLYFVCRQKKFESSFLHVYGLNRKFNDFFYSIQRKRDFCMIMMYHASLLMTFLDLLERREGPHTGKKLCKNCKSQ